VLNKKDTYHKRVNSVEFDPAAALNVP